MKKLCCMLCLLVCLGLLSGCSGNAEDGGVRESEPTTVTPLQPHSQAVRYTSATNASDTLFGRFTVTEIE